MLVFRRLGILGLALLASCSGGGGSSYPLSLSLTPNPLTASYYQYQTSTSVGLSATVTGSSNSSTFYVYVIDSAGTFVPGSISVSSTGPNTYSTSLQTVANRSVGVHSGTLQIKICGDSACGSVLGASDLPYSVTVQQTPAATGTHAYVTNYSDNTISAYNVLGNGALMPLDGSPFAAGEGPSAIAADPGGQYVYVANYGSGTLSAYSVGTDGSLAIVAGGPIDIGSQPGAIIVDPSGQYVYVVTNGGSAILAYRLGAGGMLTPLQGSPFTVVPGGAGTVIGALAIDSGGPYLYAVGGLIHSASVLYASSIGADGSLAVLTESPFVAPYTYQPSAIAVDSALSYVYVADIYGHILANSIDGTGAVAATGVYSQTCCGNNIGAMIVDPSGKYLYVTETNLSAVVAFSIGLDGSLSEVGTGNVPNAFGGTGAMAVSPDGKFVYSIMGTNNVGAFSVGADGSMTTIGGSPFAAGNGSRSIAVIKVQ